MFQSIREPQIRVSSANEEIAHSGGGDLNAVLLAELRPNDSAEIVCVYEKDRQFLEFLEGLHLRPSTKVDVVKREYDETMTLRANGKKLHLGKPATTRIWVRRLSA